MLFLFFLVFTNCEKEEEKEGYREAFCGDFFFETIQGWETISNTGNSDTIEFYSSIRMVDNTDSLILIQYKPGDNISKCGNLSYGSSIEAIINGDGELVFDINYELCPHTIFNGFFIGVDSIQVDITEYALGGKVFQKISGYRKNNS